MPRALTNEAIVASEVLLSDEHGADLGRRSRAEALALAHERGCDLVQEAVFSSPPRCRLVPAGAAPPARRVHDTAGAAPKEIRVGTAMAAHDLETRRRQAAALLARGYPVKLSARLSKAERARPASARALLDALAAELASEGRAQGKPFGESGALSLMIVPRDNEAEEEP